MRDGPEAALATPAPEVAPSALLDAPPAPEITQLNPRWRIADDGHQWVLQLWKGRDWRARRFHVERKALLESIVELCGAVDQPTIWDIRRNWPTRYR